jgi:hypothetical protein
VVLETINHILQEKSDVSLVSDINKLMQYNSKSEHTEKLRNYVNDMREQSNRFQDVIKYFHAGNEEIHQKYMNLSLKLMHANHELSMLSHKFFAMSELTLEMMRESNQKNMMTTLAEKTRSILNADFCITAIFGDHTMVHPEKLKYYVFASYDRSTEIHYGDMPHGMTFLQMLLNHQDVLLVNNATPAVKEEFRIGHPETNHIMGVKLATPTNIYGYIYLVNTGISKTFSEIDREIMSLLAAKASFLVEFISMYDVLQKYAANLQVNINDFVKKSES